MQIKYLHDWNVSVEQAVKIQRDLAKEIQKHDNIEEPRLIAGVDVSVNALSIATAAAVILDYPELTIREKVVVEGKVSFPYIPGLLSFRELPLTIKACEKLKAQPDMVLVDGQGIAHPRRLGLASHLGLFLDVPTIGCAKSSLYGIYQAPGNTAGSYSLITDNEENVIGAVLRTKNNVKPLFVSIGHKIDLTSSIHWVIQCCRGYRLPEPTRLAHLTSKGIL